MKKSLIYLTAVLFILTACQHKVKNTEQIVISKMDGQTEAIEDSLKKANALALQSHFKRVVYPKAQTQPVAQESGVDAADDPAIWYNINNPKESRILGTDKQAGLALYNLEGQLIHFSAVGRVNNVDLRYDFDFNGRKIAIAAATERNLNAIMLFEVRADSLVPLQTTPTKLDSNIIDDAYGCCMYYSRKKQAYYVFVCGKNGTTQQWRIQTTNGVVDLVPVRQIHFSSQCEGMVADDEEGILYVAEEGKAIWKLDAEEEASTHSQALHYSDSLNVHITYDLEGLDIYYAGNNKGYLIASIQGNFSYAIFEKQSDNKYLGNFVIKSNKHTDGAEETDGLAVCNLAMGNNFPQGLLVVQDGFNIENKLDAPQNFKLIDWHDIAVQYENKLNTSPDFIWWK